MGIYVQLFVDTTFLGSPEVTGTSRDYNSDESGHPPNHSN
jgi:hypothetical protein